ncbi:hypothetical protein [Mixta mediterraneensis]|uniref:hypothetical protein n=1 Tax=Mixta mediterraneensis TaxID=2758443 RepID=UPI001874538C|nr:hypothetical protein [Mixta mediterraneensis]MBE5251613.1 hypothetical protein [Mixta mediterraneensis]
MKLILSLSVLLSSLLVGSTFAQTTRYLPSRAPIAQLTPIAAKCDVSACQTNCYVERSQCKNRDNGSCSSQAQICVQSYASQCK